MTRTFLDLLHHEAPRADFDALLAASSAEAGPERAAALRREHDLALRLRDLIARQRAREAELSALYETAGDLTAIRDVDRILTAIVRRARQLLNADMTYLSLNDEEEGASYMRVTEGALTAEFRRLRLPLGTGLLGLVAQAGEPYFTEDYQSDQRFVHQGFIDEAVAGERIRAILGVPLVVEGRVIGALLAVHRTVRPFPPSEVSLLTSFAAHAAVALENARLFAELDEANRTMRAHTAAVDAAATAHDRLTDIVLHGGGVEEVVAVLAGVLGSPVGVHDALGELLAGEPGPPGWEAAVPEARASGRAVETPAAYVAPALAGAEHLATLVLRREGAAPLGLAEQRTLERGALVTALVLLFARSVAETEERLGAELLADLLEARGGSLTLRERARRHGVALEPPLAVAVAAVEGLDRRAALRAATRSVRQGLAGEHAGRLVLLSREEDAAALGERLREHVAERGGTATVGVAPVVPDEAAAAGATGEDLQAAHRDARRCAEALVVLGRRGQVSDAAGLGVARLLLGDGDAAGLADFVERTLGPVLAYDRQRGTALLETLEAWFAAGGGLAATAERLHVHPNTVAQRLDRVGGLLGAGWRDPDRALDVQLALRIARLRA